MKSQLIGANAVGQVDRKYILLTTSNDATSTTTTSSSSNSNSGKKGKGRRTQNDYGACLGHVVVADQHAVDERVKMESMAAPYYAMQMQPPSSGEGPSIQGGIERRDVQVALELTSEQVEIAALSREALKKWGFVCSLPPDWAKKASLSSSSSSSSSSARAATMSCTLTSVPLVLTSPCRGRLCGISETLSSERHWQHVVTLYGHQLSIGSWLARLSQCSKFGDKVPTEECAVRSRSSLVLTSPFNARTVG